MGAMIKEGGIQMADGKPKGVPPSERTASYLKKEGSLQCMALIKDGGYRPEHPPPVNPEMPKSWGGHTIKEVYEEAGKAFADRVVAFHGGNREYAASWFYSCRMPSFENKTPAELIREGKISELEKIIGTDK